MNREAVKAQLLEDEGVRYKPYRDTTGHLTIGVGRNLDARGLSPAEVLFLLDNDVTDHWVELVKALPWVQYLDEPRQGVLLNMAFNLGVPGLLKFKQTIAAVQNGEYIKAAQLMLQSKWATQVGQRARRLARVMEG